MTELDKHPLVLLGGDVIGDLRQDHHGQLSFVYRESWRGNSAATPLSRATIYPKIRQYDSTLS